MKTISIFLASSNELKSDREKFEIQISRKSNLWIGENVRLELEIWEDFTAKMSKTRSQDEYNKIIKDGDVFVLLAHTKVGKYTEEEFITAFGAFQETKKPFIFTYFKNSEVEKEASLEAFQNKLKDLGHFYCFYTNFDNLWIQFNKELDRLLLADFKVNDISESASFNVDNKGATIKTQFNNGTFNNTTFN
ncbi:hypothetical protein [Kordia antarctica]|nr:hypothetical protein [Kordia antarctica]